MVTNKEIKTKLKEKRDLRQKNEREIEKKKRKEELDKKLKKIISNNISVLNQSLTGINEILENETERGESARRRINSIMGFSGVISSLFLFFWNYLLNFTENWVMLIVFVYFSIIIYLLKIGYYFLKSNKPIRSYCIEPTDIIREIQNMESKEALRYEIARKILDYYDKRGPNNLKLQCLERMQNNLVCAFIFLLITAFLIVLNSHLSSISLPTNLELLLLIMLISLAISSDKIYDYFFGIWD